MALPADRLMSYCRPAQKAGVYALGEGEICRYIDKATLSSGQRQHPALAQRQKQGMAKVLLRRPCRSNFVVNQHPNGNLEL